MKTRDALAFTALCVTGISVAKPAFADQWQVSVRTLGLPEAPSADRASKPSVTPQIMQPSPQELFAVAIAKGDIARASEVAARANDPGLARQLAWTLFNANRVGEAHDWFARSSAVAPSAEATYGVALAAYELKDLDAADIALANGPPPQNDDRLKENIDQLQARIALRRADAAMAKGDFAGVRQYAGAAVSRSAIAVPDANSLLALAALREAQLSFDRGDFALARERAHTAARDPQLAEPAGSIEAWAALKAGDSANAADLFANLYQRTPSAEAAQGLFLAYDGDVGAPKLRTIAATDRGPLRTLIEARLAEQAFSRNDFITASKDARYQVALASSADPWVQQTTRFNQRNGESGRDSFKVVQSIWSAGMARGHDLFQGDIGVARADSGRASPPLNIGTPGAAWTFPPVSVSSTWTPQLQLRREGKMSPTLAIGASPIGGAVKAAFTGYAGIRVAMQHGEANTAAFARARGDSLLASTGLRDPATGLTWGRVIERGIEGSMRRDMANQLSLSATASASELEGKRTASNQRLRAGLSLSKNWQMRGFKYFAAGPFYGYESYDNNRNEFTFGNGGYFSPQEYHRIGVGLNFQTEEARRLVVRGDASIAYESVKEAGVDVLPLTTADSFGTRTETRNSGLSGAASASAAYRLSGRVSLVAEFAANKSAEFESAQAALGLRYTFGEGATVTSRILSQTPTGLAQ